MESFAQALNYGIPIFTILIAIEAVYGHFKGVEIRSMDTISSLSSGITNIIKDVLGLAVVLVSYDWLYQKAGVYDIQLTWWSFVLVFMYKDFTGYWRHRLEHRVNYFWNHHIIHHSSEEFNLPCALRQSISEVVSISIFFYFPLAILGVPTSVMALVAPIHLFAQFWYHTEHIGKMGFLEHIIVTPSHHRVHHAINDIYLDKNYSQIFIFWDKLFGTFQPELKEEPCVYGTKKAVNTWNPFLINFQHLWLIIKDSWRASNYMDKLRVWYKPTGWRPKDVAEKYPIAIIENVHEQKKFKAYASPLLLTWSWVQLVFHLSLMLYLFNSLGRLGSQSSIFLGCFLMLSVFSYTALMDNKKYAVVSESLKFIIAVGIILTYNDFFLINEWFSQGSLILSIYFVLSLGLTFYFVFIDFAKNAKKVFPNTTLIKA